MNWTPEEDDRLHTLYAECGLSAREVGSMVGRSRMSVIGRANRLGLTRHISPVERSFYAKRAARASRTLRWK